MRYTKEQHAAVVEFIKDAGLQDAYDYSEKPNGSKEIQKRSTTSVEPDAEFIEKTRKALNIILAEAIK